MNPAYFRVACLAVLLALSSVLPAQAQTSDRDKPTLIDADQLNYDDRTQTSVFTGNVVLTRGSLIIRSDRLELRQHPDGTQTGIATATGDRRVFVRQQREGLQEHVEGTSRRAEYDGRNELIHFIGQAVVRRLVCETPQDEVRGERVTYNQRTDSYGATGGEQAGTPNQRVRTILQPRQTSAPTRTPADCPPAAVPGPALRTDTERR